MWTLKRNGLDYLKARYSSNMGVYYFIRIEVDLVPLFFALENSLNTLQFASTWRLFRWILFRWRLYSLRKEHGQTIHILSQVKVSMRMSCKCSQTAAPLWLGKYLSCQWLVIKYFSGLAQLYKWVMLCRFIMMNIIFSKTENVFNLLLEEKDLWSPYLSKGVWRNHFSHFITLWCIMQLCKFLCRSMQFAGILNH